TPRPCRRHPAFPEWGNGKWSRRSWEVLHEAVILRRKVYAVNDEACLQSEERDQFVVDLDAHEAGHRLAVPGRRLEGPIAHRGHRFIVQAEPSRTQQADALHCSLAADPRHQLYFSHIALVASYFGVRRIGYMDGCRRDSSVSEALFGHKQPQAL